MKIGVYFYGISFHKILSGFIISHRFDALYFCQQFAQ